MAGMTVELGNMIKSTCQDVGVQTQDGKIEDSMDVSFDAYVAALDAVVEADYVTFMELARLCSFGNLSYTSAKQIDAIMMQENVNADPGWFTNWATSKGFIPS